MFGGHGQSAGLGSGFGGGLGHQANAGSGETVINNYYGDEGGRGDASYQNASDDSDYDDDDGSYDDDTYDA